MNNSKLSKKEQKKQNKRKACMLFMEAMEAWCLQNYGNAEILLQEALILLTKNTAKYNQVEYYLHKARQMGGAVVA